jgi:Flp pilus assembly protein TadD
LALDSQLADAHYQLGKLAAASGQLSQAVAALTKATEVDSQHVEAYYQLGLTWQKLGDRAKATAALQTFEQLKAAKTGAAQTEDAEAHAKRD